MYDIMHLPQIIEIGKTGENQFRKIEIDMRPWLQVMPEGVASIVHIQPGKTADDAYVAATAFEDGILTWIPGAGDLGTVEGYGQMEIWLEDTDSKRGKSAKVQTFVQLSLSPTSSTPPAAQESWLEQMTDLKTQTTQEAVLAVNAASYANARREEAEAAQTAAEAAQAAAETAQTAAETAQTGAETARTAAETAQTGAETAQTGAETAQTAAENAQTAAETAQTAAETAQAGAEAAAQSAAYDAAQAAAEEVVAGVQPIVAAEVADQLQAADVMRYKEVPSISVMNNFTVGAYGTANLSGQASPTGTQKSADWICFGRPEHRTVLVSFLDLGAIHIYFNQYFDYWLGWKKII